MLPPPPVSKRTYTLFPSTTLFRSCDAPYRPRPSSRAAFRHGGNRGCYVLDRDESLGMAHRPIDRRHRADAEFALTVGGRYERIDQNIDLRPRSGELSARNESDRQCKSWRSPYTKTKNNT